MAERQDLTIPQGRFVSGSLTELRTKGANNLPIEPDKQRFEFGVAVAKTDPALPQLFASIAAFAKAQYTQRPDIQARIDGWSTSMTGFSMKVSDGDAVNSRGQQNDNTKGHFVFWYSTSIQIKTCGPDNVQIDPATIKRGYYVDVSGSISGNNLVDQNAGIYMNPEWVRLLAYGDEIVGGKSAEDAFGAPANVAPLGAPPAGNVAAGVPGGTPAPVAQAAPTLPGVPGGTPPTADAAPAVPGIASPTEYPPAPGVLGAPAAAPGVPGVPAPAPGVLGLPGVPQ